MRSRVGTVLSSDLGSFAGPGQSRVDRRARGARWGLLAATTLGVAAAGLATSAQDLPPVPSKTLPGAAAPPAAQRPGAKAFASPVSGRSIAVRTSDEDDDEIEDEADRAAAAQAPEAEKAEAAAPAPEIAAPSPKGATAPSIPASEFYKGTARKAAKLSIASAPVEPFNDLDALIATLPAKNAMVNHTPPITVLASSNRVAEENRNVRVRCWLYAASREDDHDYHLILGRQPGLSPAKYMTMEVSGLPPTTAPSFNRLLAARTSFNNFFGSHVPGTRYDFYNPPIPVIVEGSLFFDMSHAQGTPPGPPSLRPNMPVIWEVHPITNITFEPAG